MDTPSRCEIFSLLVNDKYDAAGAFAYLLYKRQRSESLHHFVSEHGRQPTQDELGIFHAACEVDAQLVAYREQGEILATRFAQGFLERYLHDVETDVRGAAISKQVQRIEDKLNERRTLKGWLMEVGGNLLVSLLTVFVVGALYLGYQNLERIGSKAGQYSGMRAE